MDNMEYIDDYFKSSPSDEQKRAFEQRIVNEISFAEDVAFYISANGMLQEQLKEEKKQRFRELYQQQKPAPLVSRPVKKMWRYMAAACVAAAVIAVTLLLPGKSTSPAELAGRYIQQDQDFQHASSTMGAKQDSLQAGYSLFNSNKLPEALTQFENILKNDPHNDKAKEYAGKTAVRLEQYDKALTYFSSLAADTLFSNPGKFLEAVTLLKRNRTGDIDGAKKLLQEVVQQQLDGKEKAAEWLKNSE